MPAAIATSEQTAFPNDKHRKNGCTQNVKYNVILSETKNLRSSQRLSNIIDVEMLLQSLSMTCF